MPALIPLISLTLTALLSAALCRALIAVAPKDAPDGARKDQAAPVPTSGGLAVAATIILATGIVIALDASNDTPRNHFAALTPALILPYTLFCLGVLAIGSIDDARPLPVRTRLLTLALGAMVAASLSPVFDTIFLPVADSIIVLPTWFAIMGTTLWIFVMMNSVNFMDGSNGIAIGTLAIMLTGLAIALISQGSPEGLALFIFTTITIAALLGFLFWNLKGRLYAGDAGALSGGALFAVLSIFAARNGNIWLPATLALPILIDVFMTLLWRATRGHNLATAHRHHAYQLLIASGRSHLQTAGIWWTMSALNTAAALWASQDSKSMSALVFGILLFLGSALWLSHRQFAKPR